MSNHRKTWERILVSAEDKQAKYPSPDNMSAVNVAHEFLRSHDRDNGHAVSPFSSIPYPAP